ncbi:MAG: cobalamin-independent methionine synthase II family protein [Alphaproteobacteria bacterium]|jgi:5-methyltetrahydropteroyltriglutamate--homocysteine methyltransferase|nr:cobalamin-independent methionine synthase II family protein [Alphaproteobacteria bacterium]
MKTSLDRILTTHVGSLPRPPDLLEMLQASESGAECDAPAIAARIRQAIVDIVARQRDLGIDIVNDGENSKTSYTLYVQDRLDGIGPKPPEEDRPQASRHRDLEEHPELVERGRRLMLGTNWSNLVRPIAALGPVRYGNPAALQRDLGNLRSACDAVGIDEAFMSAASPGVLTKFVPDRYYGDEDRYIADLADAMSVEYEAIAEAGFVLQIDAPDLGSARHNQYQHLSEPEFLKIAHRNVEALNHATRNIAPEGMRMHICWGNYEGPHVHDIPLASLAPVIAKARPAGLSFEAANPAHGHEWADIREMDLPDDKILIPGVIDTTTNFVEHPRLVAQRIRRYADAVGRERVIAATDCGFATFAGAHNPVVDSVVWEKLKALSEGAALASDVLWRQARAS